MNRPMLLVLLAVLGSVRRSTSQESRDTFKCPEAYGFFPDPQQCDKYWECDEGDAILRLCPNGLAFDTRTYGTEECNYIYTVDCQGRNKFEPPIRTTNCPRLYGIFPDEEKCDVFWSCWDGESNKYQCSPGLAYDRDARVCMWADQVPECRPDETAGGYKCPRDSEAAAAGTFSRHAHPEDCRKYYICLSGQPREYGCPIGTVFKIGDDEFSGFCTDPEGVTGCEDYYGDLDLKSLKKSELLLGLEGSDNNRPAPKPFLRRKELRPATTTPPPPPPPPTQPPQRQQLRPTPARATSSPLRPVARPPPPPPPPPQASATPTILRPSVLRNDRPAPTLPAPGPTARTSPSLQPNSVTRAGPSVASTSDKPTEINDEYYYYDDQ